MSIQPPIPGTHTHLLGCQQELEAAVLQALVDLLARGLCHQVSERTVELRSAGGKV